MGVAQRQSAIPGRWFPGKMFVVGGEDEGYFGERLETGGRGSIPVPFEHCTA